MFDFNSRSPVKDVSFGDALKVSLDNYYDLLKTQVGGLNTDEVIQLKLVADTIDLSDKKAGEGGYKWWSYYNLLNRSDRAIDPTPIAGELTTGLDTLASAYERFLLKLRQFAVVRELTADEQYRLADLDKLTLLAKTEATNLYISDRVNWKRFAEAMGYEIGDQAAYVQWSSNLGSLLEIQQKMRKIQLHEIEKKRILDRKYANADDREVIDAEFAFINPASRIRYPTLPDVDYGEDGDRFDLGYLATLPLGSSALFDDRRVATWDKALATLISGGGGSFEAEFDSSTQESKTITTDWKASGSARYGFIKVKANASEHKRIQEDFTKGLNIQLAAESAYRANIVFPNWFRPQLFEHRHVKENPFEFLEFFGPQGSLLYYPTALLTVRGFSVEFLSQQNWIYDYKKRFSAKGGGGFRAFGINFGASSSYSSTVKEHKVDQSTTSLKIKDDEKTVRFVGYAVKKNTTIEAALKEAFENTGIDQIEETIPANKKSV